jgi:hypothetical protein
MHEEPTQTIQGDGGSREIAPGLDLKPLGTIRLSAAHNVSDFTSKSERIQRFIRSEAQTYTGQRYCSVNVWPDPADPSKILGFYSLASCSIERGELNNRFQRKAIGGIPVPMALIGFMGKAATAPKGFGAVLIHDAALRASRSEDLPVWGLALHPENERLAKYYDDLSFTRGMVWTRDNSKRLLMYAPLSTLLPKPDAVTAQSPTTSISAQRL